jgi:2-polyprenyl-3-methyl-5-hydroxy-6-metoxy-1,4-benzoquinol methylase
MQIDTSQRSLAPEIMDDFQLEGSMLRETLDEIAGINRWLGGNRITLNGVAQLLNKTNEVVHIVDIGCGNGDMLRALADAFKGRVMLTGIDANAFTIAHAQKLSTAYPDIQYYCMNIMEAPFSKLRYDIALCTLTLHHFTDEEIKGMLQTMQQSATLGIVVNDLQRSALAYRLFELMAWACRLSPMAKADGATSILRGFKRKELQQLSEQLNIKSYSLRWKWAFRYQWIIRKTNV